MFFFFKLKTNERQLEILMCSVIECKSYNIWSKSCFHDKIHLQYPPSLVAVIFNSYDAVFSFILGLQISLRFRQDM